MKKSIAILFSLLCIEISAQTDLNLETGIVGTFYNDIRIPGDKGTFFSLSDDLKAENKFFYRIRLQQSFKRHKISILYAPLTVESKGSTDFDIHFDGTNFPANREIEASYQFNSYRLTYRYDFIQRNRIEFGVGFTAKIRDAHVELQTSQMKDSYYNLGFVPIINFRLLYNIHPKFALLLEGDALAAKQGRAEDVLIAAVYKPSSHFAIFGGYRILEGGADNTKVYTFSMFNYASLGVNLTIGKIEK